MKHRFPYIFCCIAICIAFSTSALAAIHRYFPLYYQVAGIDNPIVKKNVNLTLLNYRSSMHFPITKEERKRFMQKAPGYIQTAVEPYGYFRSHVQSTLTKTSRGWMATFTVSLGRPLLIRSIEVRVKSAGATDHKFNEFLTHLPLKAGDALQTEKYESIKTTLYNIATSRGYFHAHMTKSRIYIDLKKYFAKIIIIFDSGPRFRFGPTTFSKTFLDDAFLHKYLTYDEGHYYSAKKLEKTQDGLVSSNFFSQVIPVTDTKNQTDYYVPIHFNLTPRKPKAYILGLGYGSDTGIRGTAGLTLRQIGHHGHRFKTLLIASPKNSSLTAKYTIPGPNPAQDHFTIGTGVSNLVQATGNARNAKFGLNYTFWSKHWKNSLSVQYLTERYNFTGQPRTSTELVYPFFDTKYIDARHPKHPSKGISVEMSLAGTDKSLLSQTSFFQVQLHLKTLYTIEETKTRLLFRSDYGYTNIPNLDNLPLSLQLFAGGSRSVRGYGYNAIDIYGTTGNPGRNLVVASTEVQQRVIGSFYLTAFIDAGVVANTNIFHHINVGTGPGVAYITSIGVMELTVANAFTQNNTPWTIQFTMGTPL